MENVINRIKDDLTRYLQNECNDYWSVSKECDELIAYFAGTERFKLEFDADGWYFSGQSISIEILSAVSEIANEALKEWEAEVER